MKAPSEKPDRVRHSTVGASAKTIALARRLRRRMSLPELLLWRELRQGPGGFRFRKQFPLLDFSIDFACLRARLAIEIDGEAHGRGDRPRRDALRDAKVFTAGFLTLRVTAADVLNDLDAVVMGIVGACEERTLPALPRNGEVARRRRDGGVGSSSTESSRVDASAKRPLHQSALPLGPPPRSGEDLS